MASVADIMDKIRAETGVELVSARTAGDGYTALPGVMAIGRYQQRDYFCELIGPYMDPGNPDVRIFIQHRRLEGQETVCLLVQDATDDAFLDASCEGIEKYKAGWPFRL